jgi:hypothetical protein
MNGQNPPPPRHGGNDWDASRKRHRNDYGNDPRGRGGGRW